MRSRRSLANAVVRADVVCDAYDSPTRSYCGFHERRNAMIRFRLGDSDGSTIFRCFCSAIKSEKRIGALRNSTHRRNRTHRREGIEISTPAQSRVPAYNSRRGREICQWDETPAVAGTADGFDEFNWAQRQSLEFIPLGERSRRGTELAVRRERTTDPAVVRSGDWSGRGRGVGFAAECGGGRRWEGSRWFSWDCCC